MASEVAKLKLGDIPELPHYMSVAQAAQVFGLTKTSMYYKIYEQRAFTHVYRVGGDPNDPHGINERPFLLLLKTEVNEVKEREDKARPVVDHAANELNAWNKRVKQWGREQQVFGEIFDKGRPTLELVDSYLKAHPEDPRPA